MTTVRALLGSGGLRIAPNLPPEDFTLTSSPDGGWPSRGNGIYVAAVDKTFFGYVDGSGNVEVRSYDHATTTVSSPTTLHATMETDWHDSPWLLRRLSDGKIVAAYCKHDLGVMYVRISSSANSVAAFGSEVDIASSLGGTADYTYPHLIQLDGETNDPIYMLYRNVQPAQGSSGVWCYSKSTDGGATWAAQTEVFKKTGKQTYAVFDSDDDTRIDWFVCDGGTVDGADAYHFYYEGGSYFKTDGTPIGALPLGISDVTPVYAGDPLRGVAGIRRDPATGHIAAVFWANTGSDEDYHYAYWDGSSWTDHVVTNAGRLTDAWIEGGLAIDKSDIHTLWVSKLVSSHWQVFRYRTTDQGATWTSEQVSATSDHAVYPFSVKDADAGFVAAWMDGTATSYTSFSFGITAARLV